MNTTEAFGLHEKWWICCWTHSLFSKSIATGLSVTRSNFLLPLQVSVPKPTCVQYPVSW